MGFSSAANGRDFRESNKGVIDGLMTHFGNNQTAHDGVDTLRTISELAAAAGYGRDRIRIDPSVVRGLDITPAPSSKSN